VLRPLNMRCVTLCEIYLLVKVERAIGNSAELPRSATLNFPLSRVAHARLRDFQISPLSYERPRRNLFGRPIAIRFGKKVFSYGPFVFFKGTFNPVHVMAVSIWHSGYNSVIATIL
jgi:hypothetical protein